MGADEEDGMAFGYTVASYGTGGVSDAYCVEA